MAPVAFLVKALVYRCYIVFRTAALFVWITMGPAAFNMGHTLSFCVVYVRPSNLASSLSTHSALTRGLDCKQCNFLSLAARQR